MAKPNSLYIDGYPSPDRQTTVIPDIEYPFENYSEPDTYARILARRYNVVPKYYAPKISTRTSWTNYLLYTETFANAAWTKTNITNTDSSLANPNDGRVTMGLGLETVTNAEHAYQQAYTFTATQHTLSWIVKPNGRTWFRLKANDGTTNFTAFFNTANGLVGTTANCTAVLSQVAIGVYRFSITFTPAASAGNVYLNYSTDGATVSYAGNTALGAYVWAPQIVRAASAGPVIITAAALRTISAPNSDPDDIFAYLVMERSPGNQTSDLADVGRQFARIPKEQTAYPGSEYFSLPAITNNYGDVSSIPVVKRPIVAQVGNGYYDSAAGVMYTEYQTALYGPVKTVASRVQGLATAGTFTLTFGADTTTALNWNDSGATIAAALNALPSIISASLTASALGFAQTLSGFITIGWASGSTLNPVTMNAGSLTVTTSTNPVTQITSGLSQDILLPDFVSIAAHGLNASLDLLDLLSSSGVISMAIYATGSWAVVDANTIRVPTIGNGGVHLYVGTFLRSYLSSGTYLLRTREIETFYLPGVSDGITTPSDITSPLGLQNPTDMINAIVNLSGFQTYKSQGPEPWNGTLIYSVKRIQINLDDF